MDLDPILSALSKLEQSINDRYNDLNNKITNLNEKVESILSIANDLHTTSPSMLQLQILLKRQNDFPLNRCYKHGNPTAKIIT